MSFLFVDRLMLRPRLNGMHKKSEPKILVETIKTIETRSPRKGEIPTQIPEFQG